MATMIKVRAKWTGFNGGPGYSNFFFRDFAAGEPTDADGNSAAVRVATFFDGVKSLLPAAVKIDVPGDIEVIEETDGKLVTVLNVAPRSQISGTAAANGYSAASGAVVTWRTGGVVAGRRVRGRTFLVPTANIAFDLDGTLQQQHIVTIKAAADALISAAGSPDLGVWARPAKQRINKAGEVIPARDGVWYVATSTSVPDMAAVLRSRRD